MKKKQINLIFLISFYCLLTHCVINEADSVVFVSEFACPPDEVILEDLGFTETWHKEQKNTNFYYLLDPYEQVVSLDFPISFMLTDFNLVTCLKNLKRLNIEGQKHLQLTENIKNLSELEELYLENNELEKLPETISSLQRLKILSLKNNHLSSLPNLSQLKNLNFVVLSENPWSEEFLNGISDFFHGQTTVILE